MTPVFSAIEEHKKVFFSYPERFVSFPEQKQTLAEFQNFVEKHPGCLDRSYQPGHVTASALVISLDRKKVLLTFHAKLRKWLQLGGHVEGNPLLHESAYREAEEESGISNLILPIFSGKTPIPFDFDIHVIPENTKEPSHLHYDARFLVIALEESFQMSSESLDLKWIEIEKITEYSQEESLLRMIRKLPYLFSFLDQDLPCSFQS